MKVRKMLSIMLVIAMSVSAMACGKQPANTGSNTSDTKTQTDVTTTEANKPVEKVSLKFLRLGDPAKSDPIFAPLLEKYSKQNENVAIDFQKMAFPEAATKYKLMAAQGELPDVMWMNIGNGWDLAAGDYLMNLSDKVSSDPVLSKELPESVLKVATTADGGLYWVPTGTGAFGLWYNKDLFKQAGLDPEHAPESIAEMIEYAKTITEKTGVPGLGFGVAATEDFANVMESFYSSYAGVDIWDDGNRCFTFEKDEKNRQLFVEALNELKAVVNDYGITQKNPVEYNPYALRTLFRDGEIAMCIDGVWAIKELTEELNKGKDSKFASALFPAGPAGSHPIMGCDGWAIPSNCKNTDEAWKLIQYLMASDNQTRHATMWGFLPLLESEKGKEEFSAAYWAPLMKQVETVSARPKDKNVAMIEQTIADGSQSAIMGEKTAEEAIDYMITTVASNYTE